MRSWGVFFFFQAEDGIRDYKVTGVQTCALPIAMACAGPVVAVAGGGIPEVLGGTGVLAPADDPAAFARALGELLADPQRRDALGAAARGRALARFSLERMGSEYGEALEAIA